MKMHAHISDLKALSSRQPFTHSLRGLAFFFCGIGMYLHTKNSPSNSTYTTSQAKVSNSEQSSYLKRGQTMSDSLFVMIMGCILVSFGMFYVVVFCILIPIRRRRQAIRELEQARRKMKDRPSHDLFRRSRSSVQ